MARLTSQRRKSKRKQLHASNEVRGMKMPLVTWVRPETRRSNPEQGEAAEMLWRPAEVLWTSVLLTWD